MSRTVKIIDEQLVGLQRVTRVRVRDVADATSASNEDPPDTASTLTWTFNTSDTSGVVAGGVYYIWQDGTGLLTVASSGAPATFTANGTITANTSVVGDISAELTTANPGADTYYLFRVPSADTTLRLESALYVRSAVGGTVREVPVGSTERIVVTAATKSHTIYNSGGLAILKIEADFPPQAVVNDEGLGFYYDIEVISGVETPAQV